MLVVASVSLLVALGFSINRFLLGFGTSAEVNRGQVGSQVKEISGYRGWAKVNSEPKVMPGRVATDCAIRLSPTGVQVDGATNPHQLKYVTVYVKLDVRQCWSERHRVFRQAQ